MARRKIFDPHKIRSADYRSRYPELKRIKEFNGLTALELITVWYYANPTSDLLIVEDANVRIAEALKLANYTPSKAVKAELLKLNVDERWATAIERMSQVEPDIREKARLMIEKILENYEDLCDKEQYEDDDKEVDVVKFVNATTKIAQELPSLINKMEEGFGVSFRDDDEDENNVGFDREYYQNLSEQ